jgi:hypothetical protein
MKLFWREVAGQGWWLKMPDREDGFYNRATVRLSGRAQLWSDEDVNWVDVDLPNAHTIEEKKAALLAMVVLGDKP